MDQELLQHLGTAWELTASKPLPSLINSHSWGQNVVFNQQLLLATVQMFPVGIGFSSGPATCFNRLVKAWEAG